jgi:hypothetical protein
LTGDIKLYLLPAGDEGNEERVDRMVCVHVFADGVEPVEPNGTITSHNPERVWRFETCKVCSAMHSIKGRPDLLAEQDFRNALNRIMHEDDADS